jgi:hypothetical protein
MEGSKPIVECSMLETLTGVLTFFNYLLCASMCGILFKLSLEASSGIPILPWIVFWKVFIKN